MMKLLHCAVVAMLGLWLNPALADCPGQSGSADPGQSGSAAFDPGQSGSAAFDPGQSGSADPGQTGSAQPSDQERVSREQRTGVVVKDRRAWLVTESDIRPIDITLIPPNQMLTEGGNLVPAPANVTALDPGTASGQAGIVLNETSSYMIHGGTVTPLNEITVPEGMILTFEGKLQKAPKKAAHIP